MARKDADGVTATVLIEYADHGVSYRYDTLCAAIRHTVTRFPDSAERVRILEGAEMFERWYYPHDSVDELRIMAGYEATEPRRLPENLADTYSEAPEFIASSRHGCAQWVLYEHRGEIWEQYVPAEHAGSVSTFVWNGERVRTVNT